MCHTPFCSCFKFAPGERLNVVTAEYLRRSRWLFHFEDRVFSSDKVIINGCIFFRHLCVGSSNPVRATASSAPSSPIIKPIPDADLSPSTNGNDSDASEAAPLFGDSFAPPKVPMQAAKSEPFHFDLSNASDASMFAMPPLSGSNPFKLTRLPSNFSFGSDVRSLFCARFWFLSRQFFASLQ